MANEKLTDRTEITTVNNDDLFHVVQNGQSYKVKKGNLILTNGVFLGNIATIDIPTGLETEGDYYSCLSDGTYTNFNNIEAEIGDKIKRTPTSWGIEKRVKVGTPLIIYVDVNGNDSNDGITQETPIRSITKLKSLLQNGCIVKFSRNQIWRNKVIDNSGVLVLDTSNLLLENEMNGNAIYFDLGGTFTMQDNEFTKGQQPIFDGSVEIPKTSFILDSVNTYKFTIETRHQNPYAKVQSTTDRPYIFENGVRLVYVKTVSEVNNTAGTFTYIENTSADINTNTWGKVDIYVHPYNSTNPTSDSKVYDYTMYSLLINKNTNTTEINLENITLSRACGKDGNHLHGGYGKNLVFKQFSSHAQLKNHSILEDCISIGTYGDCYHAFDGSDENAGMTYKNCKSIGETVKDTFVYNINGVNFILSYAFYTHGAADTQKTIVISDSFTDFSAGVAMGAVVNSVIARVKQKNYQQFATVGWSSITDGKKYLNIIDSKGWLTQSFEDEYIISTNYTLTLEGHVVLNVFNSAIFGSNWFFNESTEDTEVNLKNATIIKRSQSDNFDPYNTLFAPTLYAENTIFYLKQIDNISGGFIPTVVRSEGLTMVTPTFKNCYLHNCFIEVDNTYYTVEEFATTFPTNVIGELKSNTPQRTEILGQTVYKDYTGGDTTPDSGDYWDYDGRYMVYKFDLGFDFTGTRWNDLRRLPTMSWVNGSFEYATEDKYLGIYTHDFENITYNTGYGKEILDNGIGTGSNTNVSSGYTSDGKVYLRFDLAVVQSYVPVTPTDINLDVMQLLEDNVFIGNPRLGNYDLKLESLPSQMNIGYNEKDITESEKILAETL